MTKKWRIHNLPDKNESPNERGVNPTKQSCPPFCPQSEQQLRWESFENTLSQRMRKLTVKEDLADQERGLKKIGLKSLAPDEKQIWSRVLMVELGEQSDSSRRNKTVGKSVLMSTTYEKSDIPRANSTSCSVPMEVSEPTKIYSKTDPAKPTMKKKPSESDSVSLESFATTSTTSSKSTLRSYGSPSVATDSIEYTGLYARETLESLVDDLVTFDRGSNPPCQFDDESSMGTFERMGTIEWVVMRLSLLFVCDLVQDEPTSCRSSVKYRTRQRNVTKRCGR